MRDWRDAIHPGEILVDELEEIGMRPVELASRLGVPETASTKSYMDREVLRQIRR